MNNITPYTGEAYLAKKANERNDAAIALGVAKLQEVERERLYIMRWESDPDDRTVKYRRKVRLRTPAELKRYDKKMAQRCR